MKNEKKARAWLEFLVDRGSFREVDLREKKEENEPGVITATGTIVGKKVFAYAQDFCIHGAALGWDQGEKIAALVRQAGQEGCPLICINDSAGAKIQDGMGALLAYGAIFREHIQASGKIPQISVIAGNCAGGAAYGPGLCDFVFTVENLSHLYITGPSVVRTAIGQKVSHEELGGAAGHRKKSGVSHFCCETLEECLKKVQQLIQLLTCKETGGSGEVNSCQVPAPLDDPYSILPERENQIYDMKSLLMRILDESSFLEYMEGYAENLITGFGRIGGKTVGILANQPAFMGGVLDCAAGMKGGRFIRTCDSFGIPILSFVDTPGFMPGVEQEMKGIIREGAKLLYAFGEASVMRITTIIRKSFGGAYIAMGCKTLGADRVFAWPGAKVAVMGEESALGVLYKKELKAAQESGNYKSTYLEKSQEYRNNFLNLEKAVEKGWIDRILEPVNTRQTMIRELGGFIESNGGKHGNIPL